jgi:hypothetical protein
MFVFKGLRSIKTKDWEENKKIIWWTTTSIEIVKPVLSSFSIVILSFSDQKEDLVWNIYEVWIFKDDLNADIIFQVEGKIREAFKYFNDTFWISNIKYIKPYWKDISEEKLNIVLDKLKEEKKQKELVEKNKKWSTKKKNIWESLLVNQKKLDAFKQDINDFILEMKDFLPEAKKVEPTIALKLENTVWDLLKFKNTTNTYKVAWVYKEAIELAEKLYDVYFDYKKKNDIKKSKNDLISEFEIIKEYKNYKKVQRAKSLEKIDAKEFWFPWYEVL